MVTGWGRSPPETVMAHPIPPFACAGDEAAIMSTQGTDARAIAIDHRIAHLLEILQAVAANTKFEMDVRNTGTVAHTFTITDTGSNREGLASNLDQVVQPGLR